MPGERLRHLKVLGLACAFVGIAIAFADGLRLPTRHELIGDTMELAAAVLWGATTVVIKASRHARRARLLGRYRIASRRLFLLHPALRHGLRLRLSLGGHPLALTVAMGFVAVGIYLVNRLPRTRPAIRGTPPPR